MRMRIAAVAAFAGSLLLAPVMANAGHGGGGHFGGGGHLVAATWAAPTWWWPHGRRPLCWRPYGRRPLRWRRFAWRPRRWSELRGSRLAWWQSWPFAWNGGHSAWHGDNWHGHNHNHFDNDHFAHNRHFHDHFNNRRFVSGGVGWWPGYYSYGYGYGGCFVAVSPGSDYREPVLVVSVQRVRRLLLTRVT